MQSFKEYVLNEAAVNASEDRQEIIREVGNYLKKAVREIFPEKDGWVVTIKGQNTSMALTIFNENSATNDIGSNSKSYSTFMMHLTDGGGRTVDIDKVSWEHLTGPRAIKYRKISSKKSPMDAAQKFVKWLEKNSINFYQIEFNYKNFVTTK